MEILGIFAEFLICILSLYVYLLFSGAIRPRDEKSRNTVNTMSQSSGKLIKWFSLILFGLMTINLILHFLQFFSR
ncbi:MAG TPA: hypothetical protein VK590_16130 [Saprospiraceae bacterium]|nr:hypothetical protein [Saprospiraceae bacterium]